MDLKEIRVSQSLLKKNLFMGGERELSVLSLFCWGLLIAVSFDWLIILTSAAGYIFCLFFLRKMAQKDTRLAKVYLMHIRYKDYYRAFSTPFA